MSKSFEDMKKSLSFLPKMNRKIDYHIGITKANHGEHIAVSRDILTHVKK